MKKILLLASVFVAIALCSSVGLATDIIGTTVPSLNQNQWSTALEYIYSQVDVDTGTANYSGSTYYGADIKSLKIQKIFANVGYGITDWCELFARIGGSSTSFHMGHYDYFDFDDEIWVDGDMHFAWGFGTKVRLYEQANTTWGGVFQFSRNRSRERMPDFGPSSGGGYGEDSRADIDFWEIMISAGPTHQLTDKIKVFGGPFWYMIDGDVTLNHGGGGSWLSFDLDEKCIGGFGGIQFAINDNATLQFEYQYADAIGAFGGSFIWTH